MAEQKQNSPEPKKLEIVEEEEETEDEKDGQAEDGHSRNEGPPKSANRPLSPKEAEKGQTDDGGEPIGRGGGEEQRQKGEGQAEAPSAAARDTPPAAAIDTSQTDTTKPNNAQPPLENAPSKLRIHRVFRSEGGVEIRQCETVGEPRLVELYLKMRLLCSREQLWHFAFDDADSERDFRAMRRRLQKRFKYYEKKQKLEETAARKKAAAAEKKAREAAEEERREETKKAPSAASLRPSSSAAVQSPPRPSPPSSSGYSTTTTTSSAADRDRSPAMGVRQSARGTARRPNAGTKRQRYSPGAEALLPQQEAKRGKAKQ